MATENIRNSGVGNSSVVVDSVYNLSEATLESSKRKLEHEDTDERAQKRMRTEAPTPLLFGEVKESYHQQEVSHLHSPVLATLAPAAPDLRWPHPFQMLTDYTNTSPLTSMPWMPTPTNAISLPNTWSSDGYLGYPSFPMLPGWDQAMSNGLSSSLYQQQLRNTLQSLSPGASIAPLLAPVLADNDNTPKKSPLLEPDNHKFFDHPALLQKLALSKSPVLEAVIYCALNKWGIEMLPFGPDKKLCFKVTDFDKFSVYSAKN